MPGVLTRPQHSARKKRSPIATRAVPTVRNGFTPTITPQKIRAPSMIRRAAWRAVGLTELPAAQRKRAVCRVARRRSHSAMPLLGTQYYSMFGADCTRRYGSRYNMIVIVCFLARICLTAGSYCANSKFLSYAASTRI